MCACCVYFGCACAHICRVVSAAAQTRKLNDAAECNAQQCEDGGRAGPFEYFRHIWLDCTHNCSVARARARQTNAKVIGTRADRAKHRGKAQRAKQIQRQHHNPRNACNLSIVFFSYITNKQTRSSKAQLDKHTSQLTTTGFAMPRRKKMKKIPSTPMRVCLRDDDYYNDTRSLPAGGGGGFRHDDDDDDDDGGDASSSCHTIPLCHC